jgi:hypothetical protein
MELQCIRKVTVHLSYSSGPYRRSWTSFPTTFISAQRLSEHTVFRIWRNTDVVYQPVNEYRRRCIRLPRPSLHDVIEVCIFLERFPHLPPAEQYGGSNEATISGRPCCAAKTPPQGSYTLDTRDALRAVEENAYRMCCTWPELSFAGGINILLLITEGIFVRWTAALVRRSCA